MHTASDSSENPPHDVAVIGAGMAGLALCVFLRRAGLRVLCLDREPFPHGAVGESLDWSSPWLLGQLGLPAADLLAAGIATKKAKIAVCEPGKAIWKAAPPGGIRRAPLRFETVTLHVDREALDQRAYELAVSLGTEFLWERAARVEIDGDRITGCVTASGARVTARWYVDASGTARFFARALQIGRVEYGCEKICLWTYFDTPPLDTGTTFFLDNGSAYLEWIWDIPITPARTSVGFVFPAERMQARRRAGAENRTVLFEELRRYPRFETLMASQPDVEVRSTSFRPYVMNRVCGANWLMVGEAASMPDPLTGNGLTSGIRHARLASAAIAGAGRARDLDRLDRRRYTRHVQRLGHAFNAHIERAIYSHTIRRGLGMPTATIVYTVFGFFMNALYTRFDPRGAFGMTAFDGLFAAARAWVAAWTAAARVSLRLRGAQAGN